jgi:hypothetical protein
MSQLINLFETNSFELLGFETEETTVNNNKKYSIVNKNDKNISITCYNLNSNSKKYDFQIDIDKASSGSWWSRRAELVYVLITQLNSIANEYRTILPKWEKKEKINSIAAKSIDVWLDTICKEIPHPYSITKDKVKITLSVKMKHNTQLDIPIYYNNFQKIMPEILNTIRIYEKAQEEAPIKILFSNCSVKTKWIKN